MSRVARALTRLLTWLAWLLPGRPRGVARGTGGRGDGGPRGPRQGDLAAGRGVADHLRDASAQRCLGDDVCGCGGSRAVDRVAR